LATDFDKYRIKKKKTRIEFSYIVSQNYISAIRFLSFVATINQSTLYAEIVVAIACKISRTVSLGRFSLHYSDFSDIVRVIVDCYSDCEHRIRLLD